jgi:hypothetical protein
MNRILALLALVVSSTAYGQTTYYKHVAPIIIKHCLECHRKGETAPFPLATYEDVRSKAKLVQFVTQTGYMPPWIADPDYRHYEGERVMTQKEIDTIKKWVKEGRVAGNKSDMPPVPKYANNSQIDRKPDLILKMQEPFVIPGTNEEVFAVIKIPGEIPEERSVEAIEYIPDNRRLAHHVNFDIVPIPEGVDHMTGNSFINLNNLSSNENAYYHLNMVPKGAEIPKSIYYFGWVPGMSPQIFGGDRGFILPKKFAILLNTMHYAASPVDDIDQAQFYVFFKKDPVKRNIRLMNVGSAGVGKIEPPLTIPPGKVKSFKVTYKVKEDISLMYMGAHMHLIGKKYKAYAVPPLGRDTIPLVKIDNWDFNWQEVYRLNPMVKLRKGTTIVIEGTYDNTASNPFNPFSPPQTIKETESMKSTDEMLNLMILYLPYQIGDEKLKLD